MSETDSPVFGRRLTSRQCVQVRHRRIVESRSRGIIGPRGEFVPATKRRPVGRDTCRTDLRRFAIMMEWATESLQEGSTPRPTPNEEQQ